jgi:hypothetical protein
VIRTQVAERARYRCEYCRVPDEVWFRHHLDHILPLKHGGETTLDNLAYACMMCNLNKGADYFVPGIGGKPVRLFNPRVEVWEDHFRLEGALVIGLTPEGEATVRVLRINDALRIVQREGLRRLGLY